MPNIQKLKEVYKYSKNMAQCNAQGCTNEGKSKYNGCCSVDCQVEDAAPDVDYDDDDYEPPHMDVSP